MMNKLLTGALALGAAVSAFAVERLPLDEGWRFFRPAGAPCIECDFAFDRMSAWLDGKGPAREPGRAHRFVQASFDDRSWREVRVPHDWGIERGFDPMLNGIHEGNLDMTGIGWYRMKFRVEGPRLKVGKREVALPDDGQVLFECDGAASFAMVWINGRFVGGWPYQYTSWRVDLTPHLNREGDNVLTVRTAQYPESNRWYGGAGLYRPCALAVLPAEHVVPDSVFIATPEVSKTSATVRVTYEMAKGGKREKTFTVRNPHLWDVDDPYLYTLELEGERFRYGIRSIGFFADERGFQLNGRRVQLRGMCLHQDLGALGSAWNRAAWARRLRQLKEAGVNAIRMSHYRHAAGFYDLCDEMGFLVLDEVFDAWERGFCENDYHRLFGTWAERDLRSWVRTTRNHPCVVARTVGNEISEQRSDFGETDMPRFEELGRRLMAWTKEEDPTRPVSTANNDKDAYMSERAQWVDVYGFNYRPKQFAAYRAAHPDKPMFSTESGCVVATRGEYYPEAGRWTMRDFRSSAYGNTFICLPDEELSAWEAVPSHMGAFFWTGFDYLGGPFQVPGHRVRVSSATEAGAARQRDELARHGVVRGSSHTCETGLFDTAGFPRDTFHFFQSQWRDDLRVIHVLPHWNWPDRVGKTLPVEVFSNGDEVELFVNGESLGRKRRAPGLRRFVWKDVVYAPGAIRAVAYRNGATWAEETVETTGEAVRLVAEVVTPVIAADGSEYGFVTVKAVDAKGRVVPRSRIPAKVEVTGAGVFHAADNGDGADMTAYRWPERDVFNGYLSVIVAPKRGGRGVIRVTASAAGLAAAEAEIRVD